MDSSIRSAVLHATDTVWRRRFLLLTPFILMIPVSVIGSSYIGSRYMARSLVMLQQTVVDNPLAGETSAPSAERTQQMLKGLRALLVSDRVLFPVIDGTGEPSANRKERAAASVELANSLSVDLIGNDFLEFHLTGPTAEGLGDRLRQVMSSLINALVSRPGENAGQFVVDQLEAELRNADRPIEALKASTASLLPMGLAAAEQRLRALDAEKRVLAGKLSVFDQALNGILSSPSYPVPSPLPEAEAATDGRAAASTVSEARAKYQGQLAATAKQIEDLQAMVASYRTSQATLAALEAGRSSLLARLAAERARLGDAQVKSWGSVINAPARMIVVDQPRDPELRATSRLKFILSGLFGGLMLGVALTVLAEILDTSLRSAEQLASLTGAPVLAILPPLAARGRSAWTSPLGLLPASPAHQIAGTTIQLEKL